MTTDPKMAVPAPQVRVGKMGAVGQSVRKTVKAMFGDAAAYCFLAKMEKG